MKGRSILCLALALTLFIETSGLAQIPENNFWQDRRNNEHRRASPAKPSAPTPLGTSLLSEAPHFSHDAVIVREEYTPPTESKGRLILIEDVHLHAEAQRHIAAALTRLIEEKSLSAIAVEGTSAVFDFSLFRSFVDKSVLREAADEFLEKGRLCAPSYAAITTDVPPPWVVGADDDTLYRKNRAAYLESLPQQKILKDDQDRALQTLRNDIERISDDKLRPFLRGHLDYNQGTLPFPDYLTLLTSLLPNTIFSPAISDYQEAVRKEKALNMAAVAVERDRMIRNLAAVLTLAEANELRSSSLDFQEGKGSFKNPLHALEIMCRKKNLDLKKTPHLAAYLDYAKLADQLNPGLLLKETQTLENQAFTALAKNPTEQDFGRHLRRTILETKLLNFSLTPEEWETYKTLKLDPGIKHAGMTTLSNPITGPKGAKRFASFEDFYKQADARSAAMANRSLTLAKNALEEGKTVVLVAGGFHTPALTAQFRAAGAAYTVLQPPITKIDEGQSTKALSVFAREKTPLEKLFTDRTLFLAPDEPLVGAPAANANAAFLAAAAALGSLENGNPIPSLIEVAPLPKNRFRIRIPSLSPWSLFARRTSHPDPDSEFYFLKNFQFEMPNIFQRIRYSIDRLLLNQQGSAQLVFNGIEANSGRWPILQPLYNRIGLHWGGQSLSPALFESGLAIGGLTLVVARLMEIPLNFDPPFVGVFLFFQLFVWHGLHFYRAPYKTFKQNFFFAFSPKRNWITAISILCVGLTHYVDVPLMNNTVFFFLDIVIPHFVLSALPKISETHRVSVLWDTAFQMADTDPTSEKYLKQHRGISNWLIEMLLEDFQFTREEILALRTIRKDMMTWDNDTFHLQFAKALSPLLKVDQPEASLLRQQGRNILLLEKYEVALAAIFRRPEARLVAPMAEPFIQKIVDSILPAEEVIDQITFSKPGLSVQRWNDSAIAGFPRMYLHKTPDSIYANTIEKKWGESTPPEPQTDEDKIAAKKINAALHEIERRIETGEFRDNGNQFLAGLLADFKKEKDKITVIQVDSPLPALFTDSPERLLRVVSIGRRRQVLYIPKLFLKDFLEKSAAKENDLNELAMYLLSLMEWNYTYHKLLEDNRPTDEISRTCSEITKNFTTANRYELAEPHRIRERLYRIMKLSLVTETTALIPRIISERQAVYALRKEVLEKYPRGYIYGRDHFEAKDGRTYAELEGGGYRQLNRKPLEFDAAPTHEPVGAKKSYSVIQHNMFVPLQNRLNALGTHFDLIGNHKRAEACFRDAETITIMNQASDIGLFPIGAQLTLMRSNLRRGNTKNFLKHLRILLSGHGFPLSPIMDSKQKQEQLKQLKGLALSQIGNIEHEIEYVLTSLENAEEPGSRKQKKFAETRKRALALIAEFKSQNNDDPAAPPKPPTSSGFIGKIREFVGGARKTPATSADILPPLPVLGVGDPFNQDGPPGTRLQRLLGAMRPLSLGDDLRRRRAPAKQA